MTSLRTPIWLLSLTMLLMAGYAVPRAQGRGGATAAPTTARDLSGFWELSFDSRNIPAASLVPTVTRAMLAARAKKDAAAVRWCNLLGMPFIMDSGRPIDIRQGATTIIIAPESATTPRYLYLDRAQHISQDVFDPTTVGDSIARWEGDALIVDSVGFHPDRGITSIPGGGFRTASTHLVERYQLLEDGNVLSVTFTWTDPKMFRVPHTYAFRYNRLPNDYEPRLWAPCDPYNETRAKFLEGPVAPAAVARQR